MDKLTDNRFLFGFEGRINRFKYWYALFASLIFCLVFTFALAFAIGIVFGAHVRSVDIQIFAIFGIPPSLPFQASFRNADPETTALISLLFHLAGTPIAVVGIWILAATTIKRLHDRDKSGWWIVAFFIAPALLGSLVDRLDDESYVAYSLSLLVLALKVWGFAELMFLRGMRRPNRFGPDPLAPSVPDAPASVSWDQHSELEFVPHSAGPSPGPHVKRGT